MQRARHASEDLAASLMRGEATGERHERARPRGLARRLHTFDSLHHRDFRLLWASTLAVGAGFWIHILVVGWLAYSLTRSPLLTALAMGLDALPFLVVGPIGGIIADAWERRKLMVAVSVYQAVVTAAFAALLALDLVQTPMLFGFVLTMGVSWALWDPVRVATIPATVPKGSLVNAFALIMTAFNCSRLVMPAAAGVVLASVGPAPALAVGAALYLSAAAAVIRISPARPKAGEAARRGPLRQLAAGAVFLVRKPVVLGLMLISASMMLLLLPVMNGLMPVYASEVFETGPAGLGLLMTALGSGTVLGGVVVASLGRPRNRGVAVLASFAVLLVSMAAFSRTSSVVQALPALAGMGAAMSSMFSIQGAWIQALTPDKLRARVASLGSMAIALFPVGSLLLGFVAQQTSAPTATLVSAGLTAAVVGAVVIAFPSILGAKRQ